jgi:23S rRNA (uracil1939-C5)-methyltransferase
LQVNTEVNRSLVAHVREGLLARHTRTFVDLFMGAGNFALPLLGCKLKGYAAELHPGAVRAATRAAAAQGLAFCEVRSGDAGAAAHDWSAQGLRFDAVLCDPPRAGLRETTAAVLQLAQRTLVYCSCKPKTLCSDVARVVAAGFTVEEVTLFDMFPQTAELEVVVWLRRTS